MPSIVGFREAVKGYDSSLRESSYMQLILASVVNGILSAVFGGLTLTFLALNLIEKTTGKMGEHDGAIVSAFVLMVMAGTGFVAGFAGTLGLARRKLALPLLATVATLLVTSATWFASPQLAQILWFVTPVAMVAVSVVVMLPFRRA